MAWTNIYNDDFKVKIFEQIEQEDGTYTHGLPTPLGVDIINQLLSIYPTYYGK